MGVGEGVLVKAVAAATGKQEAQLRAQLRAAQDLGVLARAGRNKQTTLARPRPLTVRKVWAQFLAIAACPGRGQKQAKILALLVACRGAEAQYIVRALSGSLRIGLQQQTANLALAHAFARTDPGLERLAQGRDPRAAAADLVRQALSECPSYPTVVAALLAHGVGGLPQHCALRVGIPVRPMLAKPTRGVSAVLDRMESTAFTCEYKYDGERAQIHLSDDGKVRIFSRNLEDVTGKYPDIVARLALSTAGVASCIVDCEVVAVNAAGSILPFQVLSTRARRASGNPDLIDVKVCLFAFDLLLLDGEPLVARPLCERRRLLRCRLREAPGALAFCSYLDTPPDEDGATLEASDVEAFLHAAVAARCEGLMVKALGAPYQPSRRSAAWLKLKKDYLDGLADSLDLLPVGAWFGRGKRGGVYGAYLLACHNPDEEAYETICKVGTGFGAEQLSQLHASFDGAVLPGPRPYYRFAAAHTPDVWLDARQVWEVRAADLSLSPVHRAATGLVDPSRGIALRFPRFLRVRHDKAPDDATTSAQVRAMYLAQAGATAADAHGDDVDY